MSQRIITKEQVEKELEILKQLLDSHDCPSTRQIIAEAVASIYVSHDDVHTQSSDAAQALIDSLVDNVFLPLRTQLSEVTNKIENLKDQEKVLARVTSIFLKFAALYAVKNTIAHYSQPGNAPKMKEVSGLQVEVPVEFDKSASPEDAVKKLLDIPVKNKYKN